MQCLSQIFCFLILGSWLYHMYQGNSGWYSMLNMWSGHTVVCKTADHWPTLWFQLLKASLTVCDWTTVVILLWTWVEIKTIRDKSKNTVFTVGLYTILLLTVASRLSYGHILLCCFFCFFLLPSMISIILAAVIWFNRKRHRWWRKQIVFMWLFRLSSSFWYSKLPIDW